MRSILALAMSTALSSVAFAGEEGGPTPIQLYNNGMATACVGLAADISGGAMSFAGLTQDSLPLAAGGVTLVMSGQAMMAGGSTRAAEGLRRGGADISKNAGAVAWFGYATRWAGVGVALAAQSSGSDAQYIFGEALNVGGSVTTFLASATQMARNGTARKQLHYGDWADASPGTSTHQRLALTLTPVVSRDFSGMMATAQF